MGSINQLLNQNKFGIVLTLVGVVLIAGGVFASNLTSAPKQPSKAFTSDKSPIKEVKADISGAVVNPGVYSLSVDDRVEDAVKAAGGFDPNANQEFISKQLNLSQKISDGLKVYIPFNGEQGSLAAGQVAGVSTQAVGINSGSLNDLDSLPAVGPVIAQKIIDARPYDTLDQLLSKKVLSKSTYEKIKDKIDLH